MATVDGKELGLSLRCPRGIDEFGSGGAVRLDTEGSCVIKDVL